VMFLEPARASMYPMPGRMLPVFEFPPDGGVVTGRHGASVWWE
jgi:hypothetical protein